MKRPTSNELYAQLYDVSVPDWPGEVDFYREIIRSLPVEEAEVLEIACGTGRIALQLTGESINITGLDLSEAMLDIAREKTSSFSNVHWVKGDMRSFDLGKKYQLVIIPGHSFQFMLSVNDQYNCLMCIQRHLVPDGLFVVHLDHQDFTWLGDLISGKCHYESEVDIIHPVTKEKFRPSHRWSFEPATQTAIVRTAWDSLDTEGNSLDHWEMKPKQLHCLFRFEMEHLARRVGFNIKALYGDFFMNALTDQSDQMIWVFEN